ncbi:proline-rich protein 36-like [Camelus dromedarius]|uniref:proline-rich protein 36-like n=1 Tax=Camelus dromedarius TaxID=9838 RepID=UPI00311A5328
MPLGGQPALRRERCPHRWGWDLRSHCPPTPALPLSSSGLTFHSTSTPPCSPLPSSCHMVLHPSSPLPEPAPPRLRPCVCVCVCVFIRSYARALTWWDPSFPLPCLHLSLPFPPPPSSILFSLLSSVCLSSSLQALVSHTCFPSLFLSHRHTHTAHLFAIFPPSFSLHLVSLSVHRPRSPLPFTPALDSLLCSLPSPLGPLAFLFPPSPPTPLCPWLSPLFSLPFPLFPRSCLLTCLLHFSTCSATPTPRSLFLSSFHTISLFLSSLHLSLSPGSSPLTCTPPFRFLFSVFSSSHSSPLRSLVSPFLPVPFLSAFFFFLPSLSLLIPPFSESPVLPLIPLLPPPRPLPSFSFLAPPTSFPSLSLFPFLTP